MIDLTLDDLIKKYDWEQDVESKAFLVHRKINEMLVKLDSQLTVSNYKEFKCSLDTAVSLTIIYFNLLENEPKSKKVKKDE